LQPARRSAIHSTGGGSATALTVASRAELVAVPVELDDAVRARMKAGGFNSVSEYIRAAIRADIERARQEELEAKLLRAVERGKLRDASPEFWDGLKALAKGKQRGRR
jgi:Arc/MetJ-type ribon-helix-helix transcriptional regulator